MDKYIMIIATHSTVMCTSHVCLVSEQFLTAAFLPEKQTPFILKCLDIHTNTGPMGPKWSHLVICLPLCNLEVQESLSPSGRSGGCLVIVVSFQLPQAWAHWWHALNYSSMQNIPCNVIHNNQLQWTVQLQWSSTWMWTQLMAVWTIRPAYSWLSAAMNCPAAVK